MSIPFTQYLMPNGERKPITIDRPPEIEALATKLIKAGVYFDIEMLSDYKTISMTAEREDGNGEVNVLACELAANGPEVLLAVDRLINTAAGATATGDEP